MSTRRRGSRRKKKQVNSRDFWGAAASEVAPTEPIVVADEPHEMVRSLGPPPLVGREQLAGHYYEAVYDKAASLATALAAAAGMLRTDTPDD